MDQLKALKEIYRTANISPIFRPNPAYSSELGEKVPYICLDDVLENRYIIRMLPDEQIKNFPIFSGGDKLKEYPSLEQLVQDGWELD